MLEKARTEQDATVLKAVDANMQKYANDYYLKDLAYKRGVEEARLYDALSGFMTTGGHLITPNVVDGLAAVLGTAVLAAEAAGEKKKP